VVPVSLAVFPTSQINSAITEANYYRGKIQFQPAWRLRHHRWKTTQREEIVQEGVPDVIPPEACNLGWQESLTLLAKLVEAEIPG
jgi:hypothetical protein